MPTSRSRRWRGNERKNTTHLTYPPQKHRKNARNTRFTAARVHISSVGSAFIVTSRSTVWVCVREFTPTLELTQGWAGACFVAPAGIRCGSATDVFMPRVACEIPMIKAHTTELSRCLYLDVICCGFTGFRLWFQSYGCAGMEDYVGFHRRKRKITECVWFRSHFSRGTLEWWKFGRQCC